MSIYTQTAKNAEKTIAKKGAVGHISRFLEETFDPVAGTGSDPLEFRSSCKAVSFPASKGTVQAFDNRWMEDFLKGRLRFFLVAGYNVGFQPEPDDVFTWGGERFTILGATPLNLDGQQNILFRMGCKRGATSIPSSTLINWPEAQTAGQTFQELINELFPSLAW